ncbi:MAG: peptide-methionine (R)-S-oxide reductase MsrB [Myxococcota bacterium]
MRRRLLGVLFVTFAGSCVAPSHAEPPATERFAVEKPEAEWRKQLTQEQFHVLREKGTERAFSGSFHAQKAPGEYRCAGCGQPLFSSTDKFDSGTGWPSFTRPVTSTSLKQHRDRSYGMVREEVVCSRCGGHLGHVFDDGPRPTGLRYCINSAALDFVPARSDDAPTTKPKAP